MMTRIWSKSFGALSSWSLARVSTDKPLTVLDVGCGGGSVIRAIMDTGAGHTVYGIDISKAAVATASAGSRIHIDSGHVFLSVGSVTDLPFEDGRFDLITAVQTHIYWDDLKAGLQECFRTLREGGQLLVTSEMVKITYHLPAYERREDFVQLLRDIGFADVAVASSENFVGYIATK